MNQQKIDLEGCDQMRSEDGNESEESAAQGRAERRNRRDRRESRTEEVEHQRNGESSSAEKDPRHLHFSNASCRTFMCRFEAVKLRNKLSNHGCTSGHL